MNQAYMHAKVVTGNDFKLLQQKSNSSTAISLLSPHYMHLITSCPHHHMHLITSCTSSPHAPITPCTHHLMPLSPHAPHHPMHLITTCTSSPHAPHHLMPPSLHAPITTCTSSPHAPCHYTSYNLCRTIMAAISLLPSPPSLQHVATMAEFLAVLQLSHLEPKFIDYSLEKVSKLMDLELSSVSVAYRDCCEEGSMLWFDSAWMY